jgi:cytoplasmic iron level regulating protein YaaA (DUF328/UPF0246 family)
MVPTNGQHIMSKPLFAKQAKELRSYVRTLSEEELAKYMKISRSKAKVVHALYAGKSTISPAIECFRGDIYSGLRALDFNDRERVQAQECLLILSGLYGALRPYDGIEPYRLEAAYRFPDEKFNNLYAYWGKALASCIHPDALIVNVTSLEYSKLLLPYVSNKQITPRFLTRQKPGADPVFVVVHAKIARGAFARWAIMQQAVTPDLTAFDDLGYKYEPSLSSATEPVYICEDFGGIGLSQRLV